MNKVCARCAKVVYPIEELKCLDKTWHKTCFKCHECGMTLNMKTYKGFDKNPYCEAHIPKVKATTIAETPELKRIAENTKIQSNVKYHADFEKQKGKVTQIADDPETLRLRQNTKNISNAAYHGDLQKKAAMERQRETTEIVDSKDDEAEYFSEALAAESIPHYQAPLAPVAPVNAQQQYAPSQNHHQHHQTYTSPNVTQTQQVIAKPHSQAQYGGGGSNHTTQQQQLQHQQHQLQQQQQQQQQLFQQQQQQQQQQNNHNNSNFRSNIVQTSRDPSGGGGLTAAQQQQQHIQQKYYDQYENYARPNPNAQNYANNNHSTVTNSRVDGTKNGYYTQQPSYSNNHHQPQQQQQQQQVQQQRGGGPQGANYGYQQAQYYGSTNNGYDAAGTIGKITDYDPLTDGPRNTPQPQRSSQTLIYSSDRGPVNSNNQTRRIGSVNEIDPSNGFYGSIVEQPQQHQGYYQQQQQQQQQVKPQQQKSKMRIYRALYDYEAQDTDEVSFKEGDLVFELTEIDAGWMTGQVQSTGESGMLPANYVELAKI